MVLHYQYEGITLHKAAYKNDVQTMQYLLDMGCSVDCRDEEGKTALQTTVEGYIGHNEDGKDDRLYDSVLFLLHNGASINVDKDFGASPICKEWSSRQIKLFNLLINAGAEITNHTCTNPVSLGYSVTKYAVLFGCIPIVKSLIYAAVPDLEQEDLSYNVELQEAWDEMNKSVLSLRALCRKEVRRVLTVQTPNLIWGIKRLALPKALYKEIIFGLQEHHDCNLDDYKWYKY